MSISVDHCDLRALGAADGAGIIQSRPQRASQICRCRPVDCDAGLTSRMAPPTKAASAFGSPASLEAWATPLQPGWSLANIYYHTTDLPAPTSRVRVNSRLKGSGQPYRQRKSEFEHQRQRQSGLCDPVLYFETPVLGGQASGPHRSLWRRRHQPSGDLVRRAHGPAGGTSLSRGPTTSAIRHGALGIWRRCSNCAGTPASTTT